VADFEKLGAFYLGRLQNPEQDRVTENLLLYDAKDLCTHAVCVGMTGSGKTGLCIGLLEEAAIDGIPALVIDPKGDLANLLLTFPKLRATDFRPWIDEAEAARKGLTPDEYAAATAQTWSKGLADWGQDGRRIARFRDSVDIQIYTPGSRAGRPLRVLRSLAAPPAELVEDEEALRDRILAAASGLLSLLGIDADPIRSREHILISNLLDRAWREGCDLELGQLIREIQAPPFERLGVLDLDSFFPARERAELAMSLNNLLASPGFAAWMDGDPLEVGSLLYTESGQPRLSILSIAHLSESERMFFVTLLLNEVVAWMRTQPGTSSLRALLYMDEVFGYFPPSAKPPSKTPMLTLLKQARAYGLGVVLATQNPVDLDYKGLSNAGTWFLGRLQTERDKARVLDGLEGASVVSGAGFDRGDVERLLSGLKSRVFLMHNVHDDHPELFHTRWALSYLRGPLTRAQIQTLTRERTTAPPAPAPAAPAARKSIGAHDAAAADRPLLAPEIEERFLPRDAPIPSGGQLIYRPALLGSARVHYVKQSADVDHWESVSLLALLGDGGADPWTESEAADASLELEHEPDPEGKFAALSSEAANPKSYASWAKRLAATLYRTRPLVLQRCVLLKRYSAPGQSEREFRTTLSQALRERRDLELAKLRKRYTPKLARLQDRIRRAEERVGREETQSKHQKLQTVVSLGATLLGALLGRRAASVGTVGRATTTLRGAGRVAREREDVKRALKKLKELQRKLEDLEGEFEEAAEDLADRLDPGALEVEAYPIRARKSDIETDGVQLVWTPWGVQLVWTPWGLSPDGIAEPLFQGAEPPDRAL
jgi:DNA helicase HerA-like ATPase